MDSVSYYFSNDVGDIYAVRISKISKGFLSDATYQVLKDHNLEIWDIILIRDGWKNKVTPIQILMDISKAIADFYLTHENAILYFQCDDMEDVPMSAIKRKNGVTVQKYRSTLFSKMFERQMKDLALSVINYPVFFEACDNEVFVHLLAQEKFLKYVNIIKDDVTEGYSK